MTDAKNDSRLVNASRNLAFAIRRRRTKPKTQASEMSLIAHLAELRLRVFWCALAVLFTSFGAFFLWDWVLRVATEPYCQAQIARGVTESTNGISSCQLVISNPLELFTTRVTVSMYLGLMFASPVLLWQLWRFITPGLNPKEKRYAVPFVASSVVLFVLGCLVAWITIPKAMQFFLAVGGENILTLFNPTPYLKLVFLMMVLFGLAFETPLLLVFLQLARVISSKQLRKVRQYAIVGNAVLAAVATPSSDPFSMMAMFIPLCIFYELAILVGRLFKR